MSPNWHLFFAFNGPRVAACSCGYVFPRRGHALPPPGSTAVPPPSPLSLRPCHPIIATPLHHHQCHAPSVPPYPVTLAPCQIHPATTAPMRSRGRTWPLRATTSSSACHPLACHHCLTAIPRCHLTDVVKPTTWSGFYSSNRSVRP